MKYLFGIASHLTFNIARKIIETDNIPVSECCFLLLRNYVIPEEYQSKFSHQLTGSYNIDADHGRIFEGWRVWKTRQNMRTGDNGDLDDVDDIAKIANIVMQIFISRMRSDATDIVKNTWHKWHYWHYDAGKCQKCQKCQSKFLERN